MRIAATVAAFVCALAMAGSVLSAEPAEPLPTAEELQQLFKDQQYQPLLQKLARVLQLKGDAARRYDRVKLMLLKGDTHLAMKENSLAMTAYAGAIKAIDDQTDKRLAATARATELLVKRSRTFTYTPRVAPPGQAPQPISVVDLSQRTACFTAMFEDGKAEVNAKLRVAKAAKTLQPIIDAVHAVGDLRTLELAAFGKEDQTSGMLDGLAVQAKDLMGKGADDLQAKAEKINKLANQMIPIRSAGGGTANNQQFYYKKGLDTPMTRDLKSIIADSERIAEAATQFADLSAANAGKFGEIKKTADKVNTLAKDTLTDDYNGPFSK